MSTLAFLPYQAKFLSSRIEHNQLEFTLMSKIRHNPHIIAQFKALAPPPAPAPQPVPPAPKPSYDVWH
jgi:hypothetical protein